MYTSERTTLHDLHPQHRYAPVALMLALAHISPLETLMDPDSHVSKTGFKKADDAADELHCSGCGCTHVKVRLAKARVSNLAARSLSTSRCSEGIARGPRPFTVSAASQARLLRVGFAVICRRRLGQGKCSCLGPPLVAFRSRTRVPPDASPVPGC